MKTTRFCVLTLLLLSTLFLSNVFSQGFQPRLTLRTNKRQFSVAFSPDSTTLATGTWEGTIHLWDIDTGERFDTLREGEKLVTNLVFSPDGYTLASGSDDATILLWDVPTGTHLNTLRGHKRFIRDIAFSPDGKTVASTSADYTVILWNIASGIARHTISVPAGKIVFSPDSTTLATGGGKILLWDVDTGQLRKTFLDNLFTVYDLAFSPDGTLLATSTSEGAESQIKLRLWDVDTGQLRKTLAAPENKLWVSYRSVAFSPDGAILATGVRRGTVHSSLLHTLRLWDVDTGQHLYTLTGYTGLIEGVAFSPDGTTLVGEAAEIKIHLWDVSTRVRITPSPMESPAVGEQLTLILDIVSAQNVGGYQATIQFDETALRYVKSENGDYLPPGAFFVPPVVNGNQVTLGATTLAGSSTGIGTLATLTFEVLAAKESLLTLQETIITNTDGTPMLSFNAHGRLTPSSDAMTVNRVDVNRDGVVNILDLVVVAASMGQDVPKENDPADVNEDGVVNIIDLVTVAGALGGDAAAPAAHTQAFEMFTAADIQHWITQAEHLALTDETSQRGIRFLEQLLAALTPKETTLLPNYPNPFNPETWIPYQLANPAVVSISIHTADGKLVRTLALGNQPTGMYQSRSRAAYWDGRNEVGESVASGVYFYMLTAGDFTATKKMLIRK